jgi:hypothetical protein
MATAPTSKPPDWNWNLLLPVGLVAVVLVLTRTFVARRPFGLEDDNTVQVLQFALAGVALGVMAWGYRLARAGKAGERQLLRDRLLVAVGLCSFLGYFNFGHLHYGNFVHVWDTYHYVMGAKYFPELGYDKLYDCAAVVDAENGRKDELLRRTFTDLRTNVIVRPDDILAHPERCKAAFTPARWQDFTRDINAFHGLVNEVRWKEIHQDHGYNATPVWTLAGLALTNWSGPVTLEVLTRLDLLDPLYLALTMVVVWWAFGPRGFALAALTLGTNFANRYYWTGGAFLRHDWVFYLVASIALLRKDFPVLSGMAFAYATLLRLFPGLAALGPIIAALEYLRQHRRLDPRFLRWVAGGAAATALLVGVSLATLGGVSTWEHFAQNTVKHASTPLTNHMGLRTVLSWRPDTIGQRLVDNSQLDNWARWKAARLQNWHQALPLFWALLAFAAWLTWMAVRASGTEPWFALALGIGFIVFGAELTNYYYCFLMGLAVLHVQRREVGMIIAALAMTTQVLNWGPFQWMSRWLDEQYTAMSLASLFAVVGIWWLFTRWGQEAAFAPEPAPVLGLPFRPGTVPEVEEGPKRKRRRKEAQRR